MPMYEYRCDACDLIFEARQKFADPPLESCQSCGGSVQKLISRTGFALKGGGWYQQGYAESSPAACASAGAKPACAGCPKAVNE
jgi:putative FmdB family regulatory protein